MTEKKSGAIVCSFCEEPKAVAMYGDKGDVDVFACKHHKAKIGNRYLVDHRVKGWLCCYTSDKKCLNEGKWRERVPTNRRIPKEAVYCDDHHGKLVNAQFIGDVSSSWRLCRGKGCYTEGCCAGQMREDDKTAAANTNSRAYCRRCAVELFKEHAARNIVADGRRCIGKNHDRVDNRPIGTFAEFADPLPLHGTHCEKCLDELQHPVRVRSGLCKHEQCTVRATYDERDRGTTPIRCMEHMSDLRDPVNVVSPRCKEPECERLVQKRTDGPGLETYCPAHKLAAAKKAVEDAAAAGGACGSDLFVPEDTGIVFCAHPECLGKRSRAEFGEYGTEQLVSCDAHKRVLLSDPIDLAHDTCKRVKEDGRRCCARTEGGRDGLCFSCLVIIHPDMAPVRRTRGKQRAMVAHLNTEFPEFNTKAEQVICRGCPRKADWILTVMASKKGCVIVDCDEYQHQPGYGGYSRARETARENDIKSGVKLAGYKWCVMIRFNPDDYTDEHRVHHDGCWVDNNSLNESQHHQWKHRLDVLVSTIRSEIAYDHADDDFKVVHLFYGQKCRPGRAD